MYRSVWIVLPMLNGFACSDEAHEAPGPAASAANEPRCTEDSCFLDRNCWQQTGSECSGTPPSDYHTERLRNQLLQRMPVFEVRSMVDSLNLLLSRTPDLTRDLRRIPLELSQGLCLDVQSGGTASGTPVWIWECNGGSAQHWYYNRATGAIVNPASDKCLDVRWGDFAWYAASPLGLHGQRGATLEHCDRRSSPLTDSFRLLTSVGRCSRHRLTRARTGEDSNPVCRRCAGKNRQPRVRRRWLRSNRSWARA